ncbi:MAG: hypothetical protein MJ237_06080 [bacterium]|nr:hypothetical protein [bacterium]
MYLCSRFPIVEIITTKTTTIMTRKEIQDNINLWYQASRNLQNECVERIKEKGGIITIDNDAIEEDGGQPLWASSGSSKVKYVSVRYDNQLYCTDELQQECDVYIVDLMEYLLSLED